MGRVNVGGLSIDTDGLSVPVDLSEFDFSDRSSNVEPIWIANVSLISLVGLFVGLRIFVRSYVMHKIFLDDVLIIIASMFTIGLASVCLSATGHGLGTHVWMLPVATALDTVKRCIQSLFVCQVLYACAIASTRLAIIASYLRFIPDHRFRVAMVMTGILITGLWITGVFVTIFQCRPIPAAWDFGISDRKCIDFIDYLFASSAISVTTDVVLCVLPWPYLWKLRMPIKQKLILCLLLGGGAGACIAGIMRISKLHNLRSVDITFKSVSCVNLSTIECSLGIICVSIPPLRPLILRIFPRALYIDQTTVEQSPLESLAPPRKMSAAAIRAHAEHNKEIVITEDEFENTPEEDISSSECGSLGTTAEKRPGTCDENKEMAS